jgi:hypothetical protein
MKKIGIIGSGVVGQALAKGFIAHGYDVMIGTRDISKLAEWKKQTSEKIKIGNFQQTASFGQIIVLAVKGSAAKEALELAGKTNLTGKTIVDTTNPIADLAPENGVLRFFTDLNNSLMEQLQTAFPDANMVKAFNSVGNSFMVNPNFGNQKPTMFICGNNDASKTEVKEILEQFGWECEDMGGVQSARAIEPLCMLWCIPGMRENKWNHAFKLLKSK